LSESAAAPSSKWLVGSQRPAETVSRTTEQIEISSQLTATLRREGVPATRRLLPHLIFIR
jgi:hypothetical protein